VEAYIDGYPDLVTLAQILTIVRLRLWDNSATAADRCRTIDHLLAEIDRKFCRRYPFGSTRRLEQWVYDQQLIAASRRARHTA
jgi:hypothetical protein